MEEPIDTSKLKFEDTNLALLGSEYEKAWRVQRAEAEPEWAKIPKKPCTLIWRIEKFNVVPWPKEHYGTFFQGDTFIVLHISVNPDNKTELIYIAHMWVGKDTSVDESGTGAYKIVELDDYFNRMVTLVYEAQDYESPMFLSYFPSWMILEGGIESGFRKIPKENYKKKLLHVRGTGNQIKTSEIPFNINNLTEDDVFIIDEGFTWYNWRGAQSSPYEKFNGMKICTEIKNDRGGKPKIVTAEQDDNSIDLIKIFGVLGNFSKISNRRKGPPTDMVKGCHNKLIKWSDEGGKLQISEVAFSKDNLKSEDSFIIDRGDMLIVWIGKSASHDEKKFALAYAKKYQDVEKRNSHLPIITWCEGTLQKQVDEAF